MAQNKVNPRDYLSLSMVFEINTLISLLGDLGTSSFYYAYTFPNFPM